VAEDHAGGSRAAVAVARFAEAAQAAIQNRGKLLLSKKS
jgi:hypothetical protein